MKNLFKDIRNNPIFSIFFIINVAIGLWGISVIQIFQENLNNELQKTAKASVGADVVVSSRKFLTDEQVSAIRKDLPKDYKFDENRSLYSMLRSDKSSILVNLKAVSSEFPYYGEITLESGDKINAILKNKLNDSKSIVVSRDILIKLGKKKGDLVSLGEETFVISDVIEKDLGISWAGTSLAPSCYIGIDNLEKTGLLQTGATFFKNYLIKLPSSASASSVAEKIKTHIDDPGITINTYQESGQFSSRIFAYVTDYLGIVALCALFLSCAGIYYLVKAFFEKKYKDIAIFLSLGMDRAQIVRMYLAELLLLSFIGSLLNILFSYLSVPLISLFLSQFSDIALEVKVSYLVFFKVALIALSLCLVLSIPEILYIRKVKASSLFSEEQFELSKTINLALLPALLLLFVLSIYVSNSFKIGPIFFFSLIIGSTLIISASLLILNSLRLSLSKKFLF